MARHTVCMVLVLAALSACCDVCLSISADYEASTGELPAGDQRHLFRRQTQTYTSLWTELLAKYVQPGVLQGIRDHVVDYPGLAADGRFQQVLAQVASLPPVSLTKNETYALFINAYNLFAIDMYIRHPCHLNHTKCVPYDNIWHIGNTTTPVWDMRAGTVMGRSYTLDEIEDLLRSPPHFTEDPRVHACIVCASISCPPTRTEAYSADKIDEQLTDQMQTFLSNPAKGSSLNRQTSSLVLSEIFKWYAADFVAAAGSVPAFVSRFLPAHEAEFLREHASSLKLSYFPYDWDRDGIAPACTPSDCEPATEHG